MRLVWVSFDVMGRDCLAAAADAGAEVTAVVTLPGPIDRDRSGQCSFDEIAQRLGARLIETADVNSPETVAAVREADPDMIFVVGWSQLVLDEFIGIPRHGVFGMHPTLLPRHRGRAAIPWAILSGLATTGVTLFEIADGTADSGPIVGQVDVPLARDETATTLYEKVTEAHVELVRRFVPQLLDGSAPRVPQDTRRASAWPKRSPADGIIDWETRAPYLHDWVRAQTRPYPGAFTFLDEAKVVVWRARPVDLDEAAPAGTVVGLDGADAIVACGEGALVLEEVEGVAGPLPVGARLG
ncbi:MAG TPA: methionyl-tRNA formyltransferase [Gaiellaceae bacterium]|nr:methionyl-tRNA formyltransferase [Gaiellaceae bacterium]